MRNLKKLFAVVVVIAVVLTTMIPAAFAEGTTALSADAKACADIGMLSGDGNGVTVAYTQTQPARIQALVMILRLKGVLADAQATSATADNFSDVKAAWEKPLTAYAKAHPELGFVGSNGKFDPDSKIDAKQYYSVMLTALGYKAPDDYTWATVMAKAAQVGLIKNLDNTKFTVNDLAVATIETLKTNIKDGSKTLLLDLVAKDATFASKAQTAGLYTPAPVVFGVDSVTALNLKQLKVVFNKTLDGASAGTATNYTVNGTTYLADGTANTVTTVDSAAVQPDNKTVILTLTGSNANQVANQTLTVSSAVKDSSGNPLSAAVTKTGITYVDTTNPTVTGVTAVGPQTVEVAFSEPVTYGALPGTSKSFTSADFLIDSGAVSVTTATADYSGSKVTLNLSAGLSAGSHTIVINNAASSDFVDFANYQVIKDTKTFNYAAVTTAPTVSVKSAEPAKVTLKFSAAVKNVASATIYHDFSNLAQSGIAVAVGGDGTYSDTWDVPFATNLISGTSTIYVKNLAGTEIQDRYGNKFVDASVAATPSIDNTAPTVVSVTASSNKVIKVKFSEDVLLADAQNPQFYTFKKSDGTVMTSGDVTGLDAYGHPSSATLSYDVPSTTVTITFGSAFGTANFQLTSKDIKDTVTYTTNKLAENTQTFNVTNTSTLALQSAVKANNTFILTFNKAVATSGSASALSVNNYRVNWNASGTETLPSGTTATVGVSSNIVVLTIPDLSRYVSATTKISTLGIADATGSAIDPFAGAAIVSNDAGVALNSEVINVKLTAKDTITFEVKQPLQSVDASKILLGGTKVDSASFVNQTLSDGSTFGAVVTAKIVNGGNGNFPLDTSLSATPSLTDKATHADQALTFSNDAFTNLQGTKSTVAGYTGIKDYAAAYIDTVTTSDSNANGKLDTLRVTFSEPVKTGSVSLDTFKVDSYTVSNVVPVGVANGATAVYDVSIVEGGVGDTSATPKLYLNKAVTDNSAQGNVTAAQTITDAVTSADKAGPAIIGVSYNGTTGLTVTFSESISDATLLANGSDFTVAGSAMGAETWTAATGATANDNTVVLTLSADPGAASGETITISLAGAGTISDANANVSTQTAVGATYTKP